MLQKKIDVVSQNRYKSEPNYLVGNMQVNISLPKGFLKIARAKIDARIQEFSSSLFFNSFFMHVKL